MARMRKFFPGPESRELGELLQDYKVYLALAWDHENQAWCVTISIPFVNKEVAQTSLHNIADCMVDA